jgi:hypothetical protein
MNGMENQKPEMMRPIPQPDVMPVDREKWMQELHLSNFINTYYQYRDLSALDGVRKILEIGPGQGLSTLVLRSRGYSVTTFDIDRTFSPDHVGSVHDMKMFGDKRFDAVLASHVLEHLAEPYLDMALKEIARVATYAVVYLPVAGRHCQARFAPGFKGIDVSAVLDVYNRLHKPDGVNPRYCSRQHFWEVGYRGFKVNDLRRRMSQFFIVIKAYRNRDWNPSFNFVLKSNGSGQI